MSTTTAPASRRGRAECSALVRDALALLASGPVYAYAHRLARSPALAEDLLQEVAIRVINHDRKGAPPPSNVEAWLTTITRNAFLNMRQAEVATQRRKALWYGEARTAVVPTETEVVDALDRRVDVERVREAIDLIPSPERRTALVAQMAGRSVREIASAAGVARGTAMSRCFRAREDVAEAFAIVKARHRGAMLRATSSREAGMVGAA